MSIGGSSSSTFSEDMLPATLAKVLRPLVEEWAGPKTLAKVLRPLVEEWAGPASGAGLSSWTNLWPSTRSGATASAWNVYTNRGPWYRLVWLPSAPELRQQNRPAKSPSPQPAFVKLDPELSPNRLACRTATAVSVAVVDARHPH
eukprot:scaffold90054_cov75-Phaeocystis_antarctica.AAC.2